MLTRRGFIGAMTVAPLARVVVGTMDSTTAPWTTAIERPPIPAREPFEMRFDGGASRTVTPNLYARLLLRIITRHLHGYPIDVVGRPDMRFGDNWGSGRFDAMVFAIVEDLRHGNGGLIYDPLMVADLARRMAEEIRAQRVRYVGRLQMPVGVEYRELAQNAKLCLRLVTHYDMELNRMIGRFDVLGCTVETL